MNDRRNESVSVDESEKRRDIEDGDQARSDGPAIPVRATDLEPYTGLRYLSKLFRVMAVILLLLLVAEIVTGFMAQGSAAIPTLLAAGSRLIVLAGLMWGVGDLAVLLVDVGHDVRAARILLARHPEPPPRTGHAIAGGTGGD